ncbi:MAG TPA: prolyl oligopeptidase family serine peptidase [Bacteroidota bacterium]|nr:prolyl oligopeptidase family serine peptidase [Bacteroidota bacterium]
MKKTFFAAALAIVLCTGMICSVAEARQWKYPKARRGDAADTLFGTRVADPYRWMETPDTPELTEWISQENALTTGYLAKIQEWPILKNEIRDHLKYARFTVPQKRGNRYFFSKNDGLQNQNVLYFMTSLSGDPAVLLDPNTLSQDGTVALSTQAFSRDGRYFAYGLSRSGSDREEISVRDVNSGKDMTDLLRWCKFTGIAWSPDNKGFYYDRYPEPGTVPKEDENNYDKVYWHTLGTPQTQDRLIYERPDAKELGFGAIVTDDGKYLFLYVGHGTDAQNRLYYRERSSDGPFIRLIDTADAGYGFLGNIGPIVYLQTDLNAPHGKIIAVDLDHPDRRNWKDVVPEQADVISSVNLVDRHFVVVYLHDAHNIMKIYALDGTPGRDVALPTLGTANSVSGEQNDKEFFFQFTSFLYPPTVFRYSFEDNTLTVFRKSGINIDPTQFETIQVFAPSKDGTKIPMFLTYQKGIKLDGNNPTILYGYGGFSQNILPSFSSTRLIWLENGGIYASAVLRGGNEYGEEWHKAGMLGKKQNVFDDFIACAHWLIDQKYTSTPKLAIQGGSNGGLLVSACMIQEPHLFGAVIDQVPVTDMLRYQKFTVGRYWTGEYGNAEASADQFRNLYAYSPLHNVKKGTTYPPVLITTADHDDRVVPSHAMKFCATLQEADAGVHPILIRIDTKAGHGGGKPTAKQIEELTDIYTFLFETLQARLEN